MAHVDSTQQETLVEPINFRVHAGTTKALDEWAEEERTDRSSLLRRIVYRELSRRQRQLRRVQAN
jgi:hypothetical protein